MIINDILALHQGNSNSSSSNNSENISRQYDTHVKATPGKVVQLLTNNKINDLPVKDPMSQLLNGVNLGFNHIDDTTIQMPTTLTLDNNRTLLIGMNSSSLPYAVIITTTNNVIKRGNSLILDGTTGSTIIGTVIDTDKVLVLWQTSSNVRAILLSISNDSISIINNIAGLFTTNYANFLTLTTLDNERVFVGYRNASTGYPGGSIISVNGTNITLGSFTSVTTSSGYTPIAIKVDTDKVFYTFQCSNDNNYNGGVILNINGTTITAAGAFTRILGIALSYISGYSPSPGKVLLVGSSGSVFFINASGTIPTTITTLSIYGYSFTSVGIDSIDSNRAIVVGSVSSITPNRLLVNVVTISGNTLTASPMYYGPTATTIDRITVNSLTTGKLLFTFMNGADSSYTNFGVINAQEGNNVGIGMFNIFDAAFSFGKCISLDNTRIALIYAKNSKIYGTIYNTQNDYSPIKGITYQLYDPATTINTLTACGIDNNHIIVVWGTGSNTKAMVISISDLIINTGLAIDVSSSGSSTEGIAITQVTADSFAITYSWNKIRMLQVNNTSIKLGPENVFINGNYFRPKMAIANGYIVLGCINNSTSYNSFFTFSWENLVITSVGVQLIYQNTGGQINFELLSIDNDRLVFLHFINGTTYLRNMTVDVNGTLHDENYINTGFAANATYADIARISSTRYIVVIATSNTVNVYDVRISSGFSVVKTTTLETTNSAAYISLVFNGRIFLAYSHAINGSALVISPSLVGTPIGVLKQDNISVVYKGIVSLPGLLKPGDKYYYDSNGNLITTPTSNTYLGIALNTDELLIKDYII